MKTASLLMGHYSTCVLAKMADNERSDAQQTKGWPALGLTGMSPLINESLAILCAMAEKGGGRKRARGANITLCAYLRGGHAST